MPSANPSDTPLSLDIPQVKGRYATIGDYTVGFETYPRDVDPAPLFVGLPDDRCQCPHWDVVTDGELTFRWADRMETYREGDAYYVEPGHVPLMTAGTSVIEFSPTEALEQTIAIVSANMERSGAEA